MPPPPRLGLEMLLVAVVDQRIEAVDAFGDHVAAMAAVAAVRPAELDELLAPERDAAVPARAGLDIDLGFVEEFHFLPVMPGLVPGIHALLSFDIKTWMAGTSQAMTPARKPRSYNPFHRPPSLASDYKDSAAIPGIKIRPPDPVPASRAKPQGERP